MTIQLYLYRIAVIAVVLTGAAHTAPAQDSADPPARLIVTLTDGSIVNGETTLTQITVASGFGDVTIPLASIYDIRSKAGQEKMQISMWSGDKLSGRPTTKTITAHTTFGDVKIPYAQIQRMQIRGLAKLPQHMHVDIVAHYTFDNADALGRDRGDSEIHGKSVGAKHRDDGKNGGAIWFDGKDNWLDMGKGRLSADLIGSSGISISVWVRPDTIVKAAGNRNTILHMGISAGGENSGMWLSLNQYGSAWFGGRSVEGEGLQSVTHNRTVKAGEWSQIVGVLDFEHDSIRLYLNGKTILTKEVNFMSASFMPSETIALADAIGGYRGTKRYGFHGRIDELMIFSKALSDKEVKLIFELQE